MNRTLKTYVAAPLVIGALLATTAAGCGSSGQPQGTTTHVSIQNPGGSNVCKFVLVMNKPVDRQIIATATVTCNFEALATHTTLRFQARKTGNGEAWQDVDDPAENLDAPPITVTATAICLPGYDMRAYATISGINSDGTTFTSDEATSGHAYTTADCNQ
jgi:hypothetical protein